MICKMKQHVVGRFRVRPRESMAKCRILAAPQLIKIDYVLRKEIFVFERQANVVQSGIVRTDSNIDAEYLTA